MSEGKVIQQILQENKQSSPVETQSSSLQSYINFFGLQNLKPFETLKSSFIKSLPKGICYDPEAEFAKKMIIKVLNHTVNYQFIDVQVTIGHFTFSRISIVNMKGKSPTHSVQHRGSGNFCTVYKCQCRHLNLAFKCFPKRYTKTQMQEVRLKLLLEEFCIAKLASCMKVGPRIYDSLGYDLMVYEDCIQFCMQKCELLPVDYFEKMKEISTDLKGNLQKLHSINIIHHDIKIDNICYSKQFKRFVFVDFGFSRILEEKCGSKSFTWFRGTIDYCCIEMTRLYGQENGTFIDLYYNDVFGLTVTLDNLRQKKDDYNIQKMIEYDKAQTNQTDLTEVYLMTSIKFQIFQLQRPRKQQISRLSLNQMSDLYKWVCRLSNYPQNRRIYSYILAIIRENNYTYFDYQQNEEEIQQKRVNFENLNRKTLREIQEINQHCKYYYYIKKMYSQFPQLVDLLKKIPEKNEIIYEDYLCLLSKVIQFNVSEVGQQILEQLCNAAFAKYGELYLLKQQIQKQGRYYIKYYIQVSKYLFATAFNKKLKGKYFLIFSSIIHNIFFYEIMNIQEIIHYYKELLQMQLSFKIKIKALIAFYSGLQWKYFIQDHFDQYLQMQVLIHQQNTSFLKKAELNYQENEINIFKMLLYQNKSFIQTNLAQIYQNISDQDTEIKIWVIYNKMKYVCFNDQLFEQLQNYSYYQSFKSASMFQYYHFYLIIGYIANKNYYKVQSLLSKCVKVLRNKDSYFLRLIESILLFHQGKLSLSNFINRIQKLKQCKQLIVSQKIYSFFNQIIKQYSQQFEKLCLQDQRKCYYIQIQALQQTIRPLSFQTLQLQYYYQMSKSFKFFLIKREFLSKFGEQINMQVSIYQSNLIYKKLSSILNKLTFKNNSLLMAHCFYKVIILLEKNRDEQALKLAVYLYKISYFTKHQIFNQKTILQFIFIYIIDYMFTKGHYSIKDENRHLYFKYQRLISSNSKQQTYFGNGPIYADIIGLMYKYCPKNLVGLINRTSKKLQFYNSKFNVNRYLQIVRLIFEQNKKNKYFQRENQRIYQQLQFKNNFQNIVPIHYISLNHLDSIGRKRHFIKILTALKYISIYAKEHILKTIILTFMAQYQDITPERKRMRLNRLIIRYYNRLPLCKNTLQRILIDPLSKKHLLLDKNFSKYIKLSEMLLRYLDQLPQRSIQQNLRFKFQYNKILMKYSNISSAMDMK